MSVAKMIEEADTFTAREWWQVSAPDCEPYVVDGLKAARKEARRIKGKVENFVGVDFDGAVAS